MAIIDNIWVAFLTGTVVAVYLGLKQMRATGCSDKGILFVSTLCIVTGVFTGSALSISRGNLPNLDAVVIVVSSMIIEFPVFMFFKDGKEKEEMFGEMFAKFFILSIALIYILINIRAESPIKALVEIAYANISNPLDARIVVYFIENGIPAILAGLIIATANCMYMNRFSGKKYAQEIHNNVLDEMTGKISNFCDYMMPKSDTLKHHST